MAGFRTAWVLPVSPTYLPNGQGASMSRMICRLSGWSATTRMRLLLEYLVQQRSERIDELTGKLEQSREQIRRLDEECEHLADMVRLMPQLAGL